MKYTLTFKTPDVLDQISEQLNDVDADEAKLLARKFVQFGEYLRVELDTEAKTATVLKTQ